MFSVLKVTLKFYLLMHNYLIFWLYILFSKMLACVNVFQKLKTVQFAKWRFINNENKFDYIIYAAGIKTKLF